MGRGFPSTTTIAAAAFTGAADDVFAGCCADAAIPGLACFAMLRGDLRRLPRIWKATLRPRSLTLCKASSWRTKPRWTAG